MQRGVQQQHIAYESPVLSCGEASDGCSALRPGLPVLPRALRLWGGVAGTSQAVPSG